MYNRSSRCPVTGRLSRIRNQYHDLTAERRGTQMLELAKQLKIASGSRHTPKYFVKKYRTLEALQHKLNCLQRYLANV